MTKPDIPVPCCGSSAISTRQEMDARRDLVIGLCGLVLKCEEETRNPNLTERQREGWRKNLLDEIKKLRDAVVDYRSMVIAERERQGIIQ